MAWYVDGRGRRGHVSTREYRAPRNLEPLRFMPGDLGHDARFKTWQASKAYAIESLKLERAKVVYPLYPGEMQREARAALDSARWGGDDRPEHVIMAEVLAASAPKQWRLVPSAPLPGERVPYAEGWQQTE